VVSTAQHLTDLAVELAASGNEVTVVASRRGYDDPSRRFEKREKWNGIDIRRIGGTGFGKKSKWRRAIDFASYLMNCAFQVLFLPKHDLVIALTSPPLISFLAALLVRLRGGQFVFWVMDLNPDEAIAAGWLRRDSTTARFLESLLLYGLRRADRVVALDRFAKQRIAAKGISADKIAVIPPWSHNDAIRYDHAGRQRFRTAHKLQDKFVVMYSGNHSPCHPLDTLLEAARLVSKNDRIRFCFVGGGSEMEKVKLLSKNRELSNILCLGYQPLKELAGSLSAGDIQVVVMGDPFVGIVHPCKIYNILEIGAPIVCIGPQESHISDIFSAGNSSLGLQAAHGDAETVARYVLDAEAQFDSAECPRPSQLAEQFSKREILPRFIETLRAVRYSTGDVLESEAPALQERSY